MQIRYWWWVLASAALLLFWPGITYLEPFEAIGFRGREQLVAHLAVVAAHILTGILLRALWKRQERLTLSDVLLTSFACQGLSVLFILFTRSDYSRIVLFGSIVLSVASYTAFYVALWRRSRRLEWIGAALMSVVAVAAAAVALVRLPGASLADETEENGRETSMINSAYYPLQVVEHFGHFPRPEFRGGGLSAYGDDLLLVTGDGIFYRFTVPEDGSPIEVEELALRVPMNRAEFLEDLPEELSPEDFRAGDVLVVSDRLFVSHLYWKRDEQCYVVRLSETTLSGESMTADGAWRTVFESSPCISHDVIPVFRGYEMGGRIVEFGDSEFLLSVGDFGYGYTTGYAQNPETSYGKILRIRLEDGSSTPYSIGHRNPQGLTIASDGDVWSTEHGPRGGDELNRIVEGRNYGWPFVTYGTAYERHDWPVEEAPQPRSAYTDPVYSWVPSVGLSNLIESDSPLFPKWRGDFLVASMRGRSLFRVHLEGDRAVFAEPILLGGRVRDVIQDRSGRVVLWMDAGSIVVIQPAAGAGGSEAAFLTQCAGCHQVDDDRNHGIGPDLGRVFGRAIASAEGYDYSQALSEVDGEWNEASLRRFLEGPQEFAPGTKMVFLGLMKEEEVSDIIEYLRSLNAN